MNDSAALLRLLEPAVRPVPTAPASRSPQLPIEQRSFETLLNEVRQTQTTGGHDDQATTDPTEAAPALNPLRALGRCGAIDNASLRGMLGQM